MTKDKTLIGLNHRKVDWLKCLFASTDADALGKLLVIRACGVSENENAGVPELVPATSSQQELENGILELNFVIRACAGDTKKKIEWEIALVIEVDKLPGEVKAIKVNAANNADIAVLLN